MEKIIKVCGMRDSNNIKELRALDINYMGMIFYPKSPRFIKNKLIYDKKIKHVGVFVNESRSIIESIIEKYDLDVVQLHGNESVEECAYFKSKGIEVFKAFGIDKDFDFSKIKDFEKECSYFIFDTKTEKYGGSGQKYNWNKLNEYSGLTPFLLSGGISADDVDKLKDFKHKMYGGIDLNSGFEIEAGLKDLKLLELFIKDYRKI